MGKWNGLGPWEYVWRRDEGICVYCGNIGQEIDHVLSRSQGGPDIPGNVVLCCKGCNRKKRGIVERFILKGFLHLVKVGESLEWASEMDANAQTSTNHGLKDANKSCQEPL